MARTFDVPRAPEGVGRTARYGIAPRFDFDAGDIVLDGAGRVLMADAGESWLAWCAKAILTGKGECLAYSDGAGVNLRWALGQGGRDAQQEAIANAITEGLMRDPCRRTLSVSGFSFDWENDGVRVGFELLGADGYQGRREVLLDAE